MTKEEIIDLRDPKKGFIKKVIFKGDILTGKEWIEKLNKDEHYLSTITGLREFIRDFEILLNDEYRDILLEKLRSDYNFAITHKIKLTETESLIVRAYDIAKVKSLYLDKAYKIMKDEKGNEYMPYLKSQLDRVVEFIENSPCHRMALEHCGIVEKRNQNNSKR